MEVWMPRTYLRYHTRSSSVLDRHLNKTVKNCTNIPLPPEVTRHVSRVKFEQFPT